MKNATRVAFVMALGVLGGVHSAQAVTIDFTDSSIWGAANGQTEFTAATLFDGIQVTLTAVDGLLTFNSGGDVNALCGPTTGLECDGDGIGVGDDEITSDDERLIVTFSSPVSVDGFAFLDLFGPPQNQSGDTAAEIARWRAYNSALVQIAMSSITGTDQTTTLGYKEQSTDYDDVKKIRFYAGSPSNSDFSLASVDISRTSVPEPSTLLLSGMGLLALTTSRRRRPR